MEDAGTWDETAVLATSDHWWRTNLWRDSNFQGGTAEEAKLMLAEPDHRVPCLLKMPGQTHSAAYIPAFNTLLLHDLILRIFD